ncbi:hypothetical protein BH11BAC2_BH11BAC2_01730 [soil metagenome]
MVPSIYFRGHFEGENLRNQEINKAVTEAVYKPLSKSVNKFCNSG